LDLVIEILEEGIHKRESKGKIRAEKVTKDGKWELVYIGTENEIVLVHIKLRR
jgi:hypothetical protein